MAADTRWRERHPDGYALAKLIGIAVFAVVLPVLVAILVLT